MSGRLTALAAGLLRGGLQNRQAAEGRAERQRQEEREEADRKERARVRALQEAKELLELQATPGVTIEDARPHDAQDAAAMAASAFGMGGAFRRAPAAAPTVEIAGQRKRMVYDRAQDPAVAKREADTKRALEVDTANRAAHKWLQSQDPRSYGEYNPEADYSSERAGYDRRRRSERATSRAEARETRATQTAARSLLEDEAQGAAARWAQEGADPATIERGLAKYYPKLPYGARSAIVVKATTPAAGARRTPAPRRGATTAPARPAAGRAAPAPTPTPAPAKKLSAAQRIDQLLEQNPTITDDELDLILEREGY